MKPTKLQKQKRPQRPGLPGDHLFGDQKLKAANMNRKYQTINESFVRCKSSNSCLAATLKTCRATENLKNGSNHKLTVFLRRFILGSC